MKRALILLLASALATPAAAQHAGHHMPGMNMPAPAKKPAAKKAPAKKASPTKKPVAKKPASKQVVATKATAKKAPVKKSVAKPAVRKKPAVAVRKPVAPKPKAAVDHSGHAMPAQTADPHAGHAMQTQAADPHAGHQMPTRAADPHAGHQMAGQGEHAGHGATAPTPPVAPHPPEALSGPAHAADLVFGSAVMAGSREELRREHGDMPASKLLVDRLEARVGRGPNTYLIDAQGWYGGDVNKLWLKTEIEGETGRRPEQAEVQALWSRAIDPWFDLQAGIRHDVNRGSDRTHLALGVQGLAPYWWEVDGALFLSSKGELTARAEAEYDLRITQQLILQPSIELDLAAQDIEELGVGAGLSTAEIGLRLRYQLSPTFAPYVGVAYERAFGDTRRFRRDEGEEAASLGAVAGVRFWF